MWLVFGKWKTQPSSKCRVYCVSLHQPHSRDADESGQRHIHDVTSPLLQVEQLTPVPTSSAGGRSLCACVTPGPRSARRLLPRLCSGSELTLRSEPPPIPHSVPPSDSQSHTLMARWRLRMRHPRQIIKGWAELQPRGRGCSNKQEPKKQRDGK